MQGSTRALVLAGFCFAAASGCVRVADPLVIDLEIKEGDLVIYARVDAQTAMPVIKEVGHTIVMGPELAHAITANDEDALMIFVVHPEDFVRDAGVISQIALRDLDVRLASQPSAAERCEQDCESTESACETACGDDVPCKGACRAATVTCRNECGDESGNCGRCLVPATSPPQIVNDGDSCDMPAFAEGRFYRIKDGVHQKSEAPSDLEAVREAHTKIRIDWFQPCACAAGGSNQSFENFAIKPISPEASPWPLEQYAESSRGIIAGARDRVIVAFDRVGPPKITEFPDLEAETRSMVALRNGDFLLASEMYIEQTADGYRFDRFRWVNDQFMPPEQIGQNVVARPSVMKHLGNTENAPLFLLGSRAGTAVSEPAMFICSEDQFSCTAVPINNPCGGETAGLLINDAVMLDNGVAVGLADRALYLKAAAGPDPSVSDPWTCNVFPRDQFITTTGEQIVLSNLKQIGAVGDRVYLCATKDPPPCEYGFPVVLTASISADGKMPSWKIVAEGDYATDCRRMLPVRDDDSRIRVLMSNSRMLELSATATVVTVEARDNIGRLFTSGTPGWQEMRVLESGNYLAKTRFNGAFVSDGVGNFEKLVGPTEIHDGHYTTVVPLPLSAGGGFLAFGTPHEITRVRMTSKAGEPPAAQVSYVEDPSGLFPATDAIRDAVLDTASTNSVQMVIIGSGYSDREQRHPLIRRFFLDPDASMIMNVEDLIIPDDFLGLSVEGIAEIAPGRFIAYTHETRLLSAGRTDAYEIDLDWDVVDTTDTESRPSLAPDQCPPGNIPRLDAFRDIDARGGVAWAVGAYGLIVRIVGDRAERFLPTVISPEGDVDPALSAEMKTVRASCPDRVLTSGIYVHPSDDTGRRLRAWKVVPESAPENECVPRGSSVSGAGDEGNALVVRELNDDADNQCLNFASRSLLYQTPAALLPDGEDAVVVLENGLIQRLGASARREARLKVPFFVLSAYEDGQGHVLFGGYESRLSVGSSVMSR